MNQYADNGHYLYSGDRGMLAAHAIGRSGPHCTELTPVAILFSEYIGIAKFMGAAPMKKYMEEDYAEVKAFLVDLDLAKK